MKNDVADLLDLCRLNSMEEHIIDSSGVDKESTLKAIEYKKRMIIEKIKNASEDTTFIGPNKPDSKEREVDEKTSQR